MTDLEKLLRSENQNKAVAQHLLSGQTITQEQAREKYRVWRLAAIILRLKKIYHMPIDSFPIEGQRHCYYKLINTPA